MTGPGWRLLASTPWPSLLSEHRPVDTMQPERLARLVEQASLQARARADEDHPPPFEIIEPSEDPTWGRGFQLLPEPNEGDVFLDFEGDPFWRADVGLFFLFGLIAQRRLWGFPVPSLLGAQPGRGSHRHSCADRLPRRSPEAVSRTCTSTTTTTRSVLLLSALLLTMALGRRP